MSTWIFQGNPERFNVNDYLLDNDEIWWSIRQKHLADKIAIGDEVFIWRSDGGERGSGGIVARTIALTTPEQYVNDEEAANYWYEDVSNDSYLAVKLQVIEVDVIEGLNRLELAEHPKLQNLMILRLKQNTNYLVEDELASYLKQLWKGKHFSQKLEKVDKNQLIKHFHKAMLKIYDESKEIGYTPSKFRQMVANEGGLNTAKKLINSKQLSDGFAELAHLNRLDLTVEALVLKKENRILFTESELEKARERLTQLGFFLEIEDDEHDDLLLIVEDDLEALRIEEGNGIEGAKKAYLVNKYERDSKNRKKAIEIHGLNCYACGFNFEEVYGERGKEFIEIHHIKPLSTLEEAIEINPETDLVPLCANCHRMVHRSIDRVLSVEELKELIQNHKS
ncbi:EVE domain-containing protein [Lysinibacillus sp. FSL M8-0216]|uniref:EVE domain-containing protein n=1 Tax=Lysinibacillus sp. FSL M8-0216 TaxID=2921619 RepID=UPI00315AC418